MFEDVFRSIPVTINDCYGDPFFPPQIDNTLWKLDQLRDQTGPISIITKMVFGSDVFHRLEPYLFRNLLFIYSFTGLNEGGFTFKDREETYERLSQVHPGHVILIIRPIIPGRNDGEEILTRIVDVAIRNGTPVIYEGGYKEPGTRTKNLSQETREFLQTYCKQNSVRTFPKSSCAAAEMIGVDECFSHVDGEPKNLGALEFLGYEFSIDSKGKVYIQKGTNGDRNFIRFLTRSQPKIGDMNLGTNILSISNDERIHECTSSWYVWSRNISQCLGCDYCMIPGIDHLREQISIGCNPVDLGLYKR